MTKEELLEQAFEAQKNAYAPYSNFHVGAAVLTADDHVVLGANVENASYPAGACAEATALNAAYSLGYRKDDIKMIAITSHGDTPARPCGKCRQIIRELAGKQVPIILSNRNETVETTIEVLLPDSFGPEDLLK